MKTLKENQKVSLTLNQLRHLVKEARPAKEVRRASAQCESIKLNIYPELPDSQSSKCPDIHAEFYPQFIDGEDRYIVLLDPCGEGGCLWGPFPTFEDAEDVLFNMAAAYKDDGRLVSLTQSSLTFSDKNYAVEACMYIVPGCGWAT